MKATYKTVITGVFGALAGGLQIAENFIFFNFPLPGGKPGIANMVTIAVLRIFGFKYALAVTLVKSFVALTASGSVTSFIYSAAGGTAAVCAMAFAGRNNKLTETGIGVCGAYVNNLTQTAVGAVLTSNVYVMSYIWILGFVSAVTGIFTGIAAKYIIIYTKRMIKT